MYNLLRKNVPFDDFLMTKIAFIMGDVLLRGRR
jgi:hypothetical protein